MYIINNFGHLELKTKKRMKNLSFLLRRFLQENLEFLAHTHT